MCPVVCSDSFCLQEHVELHLDPGAALNSAGGQIHLPATVNTDIPLRCRIFMSDLSTVKRWILQELP